MSKLTLSVIAILFASYAAPAAEKKLKVEALPPAVQQTVKAELAGAALAGLTRETEKGQTVYELETRKADGTTRDLMIDARGAILSVEEEVPVATLPAAARAAIEAKAAGGRLVRVEKVSEGGRVSYEATIKTGKKQIEYSVTPDGKPLE